MGPRARAGVSIYLEVFLLIGIALGGAGLVFGAAATLVGSASGPSASIVSASIRQGPYSAVESVTVEDVGTQPLGALTVVTSGAPASGMYCYSVEDPGSGAVLASTCPSLMADPGTVTLSAGVGEGGSVLVELVVTGGSFAVGSTHLVSVTAASGAQADAEVQVAPA
ncbi:MAG: hypothetical protein KGI26_05285 [Thaumarchaeota archaeon]|nr:hypothetical protein [Nitrososphaerota archaeon]